MGDNVHTLTEKVAYLLKNDVRLRGDEEKWFEAKEKVEDYIFLKRWTDPNQAIENQIKYGSIPEECLSQREKTAWDYLVMDVFQLPLVVGVRGHKNIKGVNPFLMDGVLDSL